MGGEGEVVVGRILEGGVGGEEEPLELVLLLRLRTTTKKENITVLNLLPTKRKRKFEG